jgi:hypothetical protein
MILDGEALRRRSRAAQPGAAAAALEEGGERVALCAHFLRQIAESEDAHRVGDLLQVLEL